MSVSDAEQNSLFWKYMGRTAYEKWNCNITIDGVIIQTLKRLKHDSYPVGIWQSSYPIPIEQTKGKKKVKVMFEPIQQNKIQMPGLMEIRVLNNH